MLITTSVNNTNPYPGLRPYQPNEQTKFYGRDADTQALLAKIINQRLTLLFAATGVGKSSLLQAAILPQLSAKEGLNLDVVYYNDWIASPIKGIQQAVHQALAKRYGNIPVDPRNLCLETFFRIITPSTSQPLVIILDQFEEFFRYRLIHHAADFQPFIDQLAEVILAPELNISLVFSMREDFALELNAFKPHLPNPLFSNYYRLEKLGIDAAKAAIIEPLIQAGYHYEPALLDELLKDLLSRDLTRDASSLAKGTQADSVEPPYLQIVCSQLWELDKHDPAKTLGLATYRKAGGAKGLLENYVSEVLKSFSDREKQVTSKAFDHLISRRGTKMAHTPEDLAELVNLKPSELANVMDKLEKARILRRQQRDQQVWYELYHDMFSGGIETWNTAWKNHMRLRRTLIATAASLTTLAAVYFGVIAYLQATNKHLRIGNGNTDRIEIYTGTNQFPDPFGQQHYFGETTFERGQLELDKRYPRRDLSDYPLVVHDLISSQPLGARVSLYIENGEFCQYSDLLTQLMPIDSPAPSCKMNSNPKPPKTTTPNITLESDPMSLLMLTHLPALKTRWGFEQYQAMTQQFTQLSSLGISINPNINTTVHTPMTYTREQIVTLAFTQINTGALDPYQIEVLLDWVLDPNQFAVNQLMRSSDIASTLVDVSKTLSNHIMRPVIQTIQLKPRILKALASNNPQDREVAAILSSLIADPSLIEPLTRLLEDKASTIRLAALKSLLLIHPEHTIPLVANLLNDRTQPNELRIGLLNALADTNSLKAVPILLARFQDINEREEIRMIASTSLGFIGDTSVLPAFRAVLSDPNERTEARLGAIDGIQYLNDKASSELLLAHINDEEERLDIRKSCAKALGELISHEASSALLKLIETPHVDEDLKVVAVGSLMSGRNGSIDIALVQRLLTYWQTLPPANFLAMQIRAVLENSNDPHIQHALKASPLLLGNSIGIITTEKSRLATEITTRIQPPQYEAIKPFIPVVTLQDIMNDSLNNSLSPTSYMPLIGNYQQKQNLITALMTKDANRNPALARLALDETNGLNLRIRALAGITDTDITPTLVQILQPLTQHIQHDIRTEAQITLLRIIKGKDLLPWLKNSELTQESLERGLVRFAATSPRPETIKTLINLAQDDSSQLQAKAYQLLGELKASEALPLLEANLANLDTEYQTWRKIRDQQPTNTTNDANYQVWQQQLAAANPPHAHLATHYGYALAHLDLDKGIAALAHNLADVRTGAALAFNQSATTAELQALAQARAKANVDPLFKQASYLAIDKALVRLEATTDIHEITALKAWQAQLKNANDPISQRLDWTINMIQHYHNLDQELAKKYQLRRSSPTH